MELTIYNLKKFNKIYKPITKKTWMEKWIESLSVLFEEKD